MTNGQRAIMCSQFPINHFAFIETDDYELGWVGRIVGHRFDDEDRLMISVQLIETDDAYPEVLQFYTDGVTVVT